MYGPNPPVGSSHLLLSSGLYRRRRIRTARLLARGLVGKIAASPPVGNCTRPEAPYPLYAATGKGQCNCEKRQLSPDVCGMAPKPGRYSAIAISPACTARGKRTTINRSNTHRFLKTDRIGGTHAKERRHSEHCNRCARRPRKDHAGRSDAAPERYVPRQRSGAGARHGFGDLERERGSPFWPRIRPFSTTG